MSLNEDPYRTHDDSGFTGCLSFLIFLAVLATCSVMLKSIEIRLDKICIKTGTDCSVTWQDIKK